MKVINITPGLIPIPPNGWGAVEKIIWDYHTQLQKIGVQSEIKYLNDVQYNESCVIHVHVANLANQLYDKKIPYIFTIHDHHAYLYGKDSDLYKENLKAIENSVFSLSPCKYLIPYFGSKKLRYFSHAVNTDVFSYNSRQAHTPLKLLCVANNGYAYNQSVDRKGFGIAIQAAKELGMRITVAGPRNNDNFFKTLEPELNNYSGLTKLYDLDEKWLTSLYKEHDLFLHFSELEAGHPNLTLLEAMASGLPVVGTFEEPKYKGMVVCERDLNQAIRSIKLARDHYESLRQDAVDNAQENSYSSRVNDLVKLYTEYREQIFANTLIQHYTDCKISNKETQNKVNVTFIDGPKVEVLGPINKKYKVKFINMQTGDVVYESIIQNNMWSTTNAKYFVKWRIELHEMINDEWIILCASHEFDAKDQEVKVVFDTESMGDLLAFIGAAEEFRKLHGCKMNCVVFNKHMREIFEKSYSEIKFHAVDKDDHLYYAVYRMGYFENWSSHMRKDPKALSLAHISSHVLGLGDNEYKPTLTFDKPAYNGKKYVCIFTQSTAQAKYWNNTNGWNDVVSYIKKKGYDVWCIDRDKVYGNGNNMNTIPKGTIDKTGNSSILERMQQIYNSEFCIGLSSGLSWLAWAVGKPTIMISGFTADYNEFHNPYRVINKNVCNGCWNDVNCKFDKGDWLWCPRGKNFECSKQISSDDVIKMIDKII